MRGVANLDDLRADRATQRPGGRTARVGDAVMRATLDELTEVGYAGLRLDAIAARAGVARSTIYRRWGDKASLVAAAFLEHRGDAGLPPDTGNLRDDMLGLMRQVRDGLQQPWVAALVREVQPRHPDGGIFEALDLIWPERFGAAEVIFDRAIERGELPPTTDSALLVELLSGALHFRSLFPGHDVDDDFLEQVADLLITGASGQPGPR